MKSKILDELANFRDWTWAELNFQTVRSSVCTTLVKRNIYFSYNYPLSLLDVFASCLYHFIEIILFHIYWIKFLYEIWDYYNQALFYSKFSDFTPFIHLWIIFLYGIIKFSINKSEIQLRKYSYKNMQNIILPSDCIQFPVSDNERMIISCIIHISDLRNSTVTWSWGVETQAGF